MSKLVNKANTKATVQTVQNVQAGDVAPTGAAQLVATAAPTDAALPELGQAAAAAFAEGAIPDYAATYRQEGVVVVKGVLDAEAAKRYEAIAYDLLSDPATRQEFDVETTGAFGQYGRLRYCVTDGVVLKRHWPEMLGFYAGLASLVSLVTGMPIRLSPYENSAVVLKLYQHASDGSPGQQGFHYDTNKVTGLLYLTSHPEASGEGSTDYVPFYHGKDMTHRRSVWPEAGDLLIMDGRRTFHGVPPMKTNARRITVPLNYYTPEDTWRPEGIDDLIYQGEGQQVDGMGVPAQGVAMNGAPIMRDPAREG